MFSSYSYIVKIDILADGDLCAKEFVFIISPNDRDGFYFRAPEIDDIIVLVNLIVSLEEKVMHPFSEFRKGYHVAAQHSI